MKYKQFCEGLAREAGKIMLQYFKENKEIEIKEDLSPVTIADTKINSLVIKAIKEKYPEHNILGEEESFLENDTSFTWVCDPIDGTIPYTKKIPTAVFSLALVEDGEPIAGVIYDPFLDQLMYAEKGEGTFVNGKKVFVNKSENVKGRVIGFTSWWHTEPDFTPSVRYLVEHKAILLDIGSVVRMGFLVATGDFDAVFFPANKPYDGAAVKIVVEEAGGVMTDLFGKEQRYDQKICGYLASNGLVHGTMIKAIALSLSQQE